MAGASWQRANLLLNTGPLSDGSLHSDDVRILREVKATPDADSGLITNRILTDANGMVSLSVDKEFAGPTDADPKTYKGYVYVYSGEDSPLAVDLTFPIMSEHHLKYLVEVDDLNLRQTVS